MELHLKNNAKFYFVTSTGEASEASKHQISAYVKMVEFLQITSKVKWISTANANSLAPSKSNIFVTIEPLLSSCDSITVSPGTILKCQLRLRKDDADGGNNANKHPIFQNLTITSSGLSDVEKREIRQLITVHGGTFTGSFNSKETDILITNVDNIKSHKFIAAVTSKKKCLEKNWVTDSVSNGIVLPYGKYEIRAVEEKMDQNNKDEGVEDEHSKDATVTANANGIKVEVDDLSSRRHEDSIMFSKDERNVDETKSSQDSSAKSLASSLTSNSTVNGIATSSPSHEVIECVVLSDEEFDPSPKTSSTQLETSTEVKIISKSEQSSQLTTSYQLDTTPKLNRKICMSQSISDEAGRQTLKEQIEKLGGMVCDGSFTQDSCTHLVCGEPILSEKTAAIIASGGWLLYPAYIEESFKAGRFLDEKCYEWGNPITEDRLKVTDRISRIISVVAYKWRRQLYSKSVAEDEPVGMFFGFRAILHTKRKENFKALLEAGRGVVVDLKEPYAEQEDFQGVTHCFVDKRMENLSQSDKAAMKEAGIHVVTLLYLKASFQEEHLPSVKNYLAL